MKHKGCLFEYLNIKEKILDLLYDEFLDYLEQENKEKAVELIIKKLEQIKTINELVDLYQNVLSRSLNEMTCNIKDKKLCIWREHVRSSIIRNILECAYPYVIKLKNNYFSNAKKRGKVAVICPDGEYHEIGPRMVADYYTLLGYDSVYVGSSTPKEEFIYAINDIKPVMLALSVSNFYNLVSTKKTIDAIREKVDYPIKIIVGGYAFNSNPLSYKDIGADFLAQSFEDIKKLVGEVQ